MSDIFKPAVILDFDGTYVKGTLSKAICTYLVDIRHSREYHRIFLLIYHLLKSFYSFASSEEKGYECIMSSTSYLLKNYERKEIEDFGSRLEDIKGNSRMLIFIKKNAEVIEFVTFAPEQIVKAKLAHSWNNDVKVSAPKLVFTSDRLTDFVNNTGYKTPSQLKEASLERFIKEGYNPVIFIGDFAKTDPRNKSTKVVYIRIRDRPIRLFNSSKFKVEYECKNCDDCIDRLKELGFRE